VINEPNLTNFFLAERCDSGLQDRIMCATMYDRYAQKIKLTRPVLYDELKSRRREYLVAGLKILDTAQATSNKRTRVLYNRRFFEIYPGILPNFVFLQWGFLCDIYNNCRSTVYILYSMYMCIYYLCVILRYYIYTVEMYSYRVNRYKILNLYVYNNLYKLRI